MRFILIFRAVEIALVMAGPGASMTGHDRKLRRAGSRSRSRLALSRSRPQFQVATPAIGYRQGTTALVATPRGVVRVSPAYRVPSRVPKKASRTLEPWLSATSPHVLIRMPECAGQKTIESIWL
jgi:hypothetical protein